MSREVRRVPLDWKHPTEPNPHWRIQQTAREQRGEPSPRLHAVTERFVPLHDDYPGAAEQWEDDRRALVAREGSDWRFAVEYYLTGQERDDTAPVVHPWRTGDAGSVAFPPGGGPRLAEVGRILGWNGLIIARDEDHLQELLLAQHDSEKPYPGDYMPVFDVPESELGWCLYETVTEGTPVAPVFATAGELIDHLATVGQDHDQQPMRRPAAETLVRQGHSVGSMIMLGGRMYDSARDADLINELP